MCAHKVCVRAARGGGQAGGGRVGRVARVWCVATQPHTRTGHSRQKLVLYRHKLVHYVIYSRGLTQYSAPEPASP
eukprot:scaffold56798_cov59-Phaeocystis_antarctica.AAC.1